ncbi:MAG: sodium:solute symporter family transporter [Asticcacaulis sp.]
MSLDLVVFILLVALIAGVGLVLRPRAQSVSERFLASRQLSWLTLGASMAASSLSADTAILITGAVYAHGLGGNWFWWVSAPGVLATLMFFAPLWRRSGLVTEAEVIRLRYGDSRLAKAYRLLKAVNDGLLVNAFVVASSVLAFRLILEVLLKDTPWGVTFVSLSGVICTGFLLLTGLYTLMAGFRGLVHTNALEFGFAVIVSLILAALAVTQMPAGLDTLKTLSAQASHTPVLDSFGGQDPFSLMLLLGFGWWHTAAGQPLLVQRMVASRSETDAGLTVLSFSVFHYLLRPWGWYVIGAAALFYFPGLPKAEQALPSMAQALLPSGLFGMLAASVALSFLGSVNSRFNLSASYLVNDVGLLLKPDLGEKGRKQIETGAVLILSGLVVVIAFSNWIPSIRGIYQFIIMMLAGTGFVAIARWYWSGTSLLSEITSRISSLLIAGSTLVLVDIQDPKTFALMVGVNFLAGAIITLLTARLWPDRERTTAKRFFDQVRPPGPGWSENGHGSVHALTRPFASWALGNIALFSLIFAGINLLSGQGWGALALVALAILSSLGLWVIRRPAALVPSSREL